MSYAQLTKVKKLISELIPNVRNPRRHPEKQIEQLKQSVDVYGFSKGSVVIQKGTNKVLAGHGMLSALKAKGFVEVDVIEADLTDDLAEAFLIADNRLGETSEWDIGNLDELLKELASKGIPADYMGFEQKELSELLGSLGGYQADEKDDVIPEVKEAITKTGDLIFLGKHRLLCGDSTLKSDVDRLFGNDKAELLFTSPPYSDMRDYNGESDLSINYLINFISAFEPFVNYQVINLGIKRTNNEIDQYWNEYINKAKECGYKLLSWNVWNRESAKTIAHQSAMFPIAHEWIFVLGKDRKDLNKTKGKAVATLKDKRIDNTCKQTTITSVSTIQPALDKNEGGHPARFPISLPCEYIEAMTNEGDIVCDCFLGSGSTLIASQKLNRVCYGMEISPAYVDVIVKRFIDFVGSDKDVFVERNGEKIEYKQLCNGL